MGQQIVPAQDELLALCLLTLARNCGPAPTNKLSFKCSICGKAFSSYQALGGHKSSHRRPPPGLGLMIKPVSSASTGQSSGSSRAVHRCNVCHKDFATGQALGGHKRCHYWDVSSSSYSGVISCVRDFDLNLLPASEEFGWVKEEVQSPHPAKKLRL